MFKKIYKLHPINHTNNASSQKRKYLIAKVKNDTTYAKKISGNFRDRTLRQSDSLCLRSLSFLIYPISFWISENGLGFCFSPPRVYVSLWLRLYSMRFAFHSFSPSFFFHPSSPLFIRAAPFNFRALFKLILSIPHGEHGFPRANIILILFSLFLFSFVESNKKYSNDCYFVENLGVLILYRRTFYRI